jgi:glycine/D-amino acid oxidase-like deaminating enzyme
VNVEDANRERVRTTTMINEGKHPGACSWPPSVWAATATPGVAFSFLRERTRADVVVIGGGYTGLSAALRLAEDGASVVLLEAAEPGWGASGRNGGQVIPGLKYDPDELNRMFGPDLGPRVVRAVGGAADLVFDLVDRNGIECDAVRNGWIQPAHARQALETAKRRADSWARHGAETRILSREQVAHLTGSKTYLGGWIDARGGSVQPLSYARGLAAAASRAGAHIFSGTPALSVRREGRLWNIRTPEAAVFGDTVLIGTNGYTDDLWPGLQQTVMPFYSFQIATKPLGDNLRRTILPEGHIASDTRRLLLYYRLDAHGRLIIGGRGPFKEHPGPEDATRLRRAVARLFPQLGGQSWAYHWSGKIAMTADHMPHLHELAPGVHTGLGFNGRGIGMASLMGVLLAKRALGKGQAEIDFPISAVKPIAFHGLYRPVGRALIEYYRLRDALDG